MGKVSSISHHHTPAIACFKITMGPQNIMTFWHNMLHDITSWMLNKSNRNWQGDNFSLFIKGKHGFYKREKLRNLKFLFWPEKNYQYWSRVY